MRALDANDSARVGAAGAGGCGGFAARDEVPANGFKGLELEAKGFAPDEAELLPVENGFCWEEEAVGGFTPKRDSPMLDCLGGAGAASCAGGG